MHVIVKSMYITGEGELDVFRTDCRELLLADEKNGLWYCRSKQSLNKTEFGSYVKPIFNTHYLVKTDKIKGAIVVDFLKDKFSVPRSSGTLRCC